MTVETVAVTENSTVSPAAYPEGIAAETSHSFESAPAVTVGVTLASLAPLCKSFAVGVPVAAPASVTVYRRVWPGSMFQRPPRKMDGWKIDPDPEPDPVGNSTAANACAHAAPIACRPAIGE